MAVDQPHERDLGPIERVATTADSDYGSDLDDNTWDEIFSQSQSQTAIPRATVVQSIEEPVLPHDDPDPRPHSLRLARIRENLEKAISGLTETSLAAGRGVERAGSVEVEYDRGGNRAAFSTRESASNECAQRLTDAADLQRMVAAVQGDKSEVEREPLPTPSVEPDASASQAAKSPLERFRTRPKKPLSVTDLVSPAWCELKYWYSLTRHGRVRRTAAMKAGSRIHKEKEMEVHVTVPVQIVTKEDQLGLRLWNTISGLRTLRSTGLTRELEVLGLVEGEVVVGILDEISYTCPDEELETELLEVKEGDEARGSKKKAKAAMPADQRTMTDFFASPSGNGSALDDRNIWSSHRQPRTLYLVDIKTRSSNTIPKLDSQMRATQMQLMLYRRLLNDLAANNVEAERIFERYGMDQHRPFSDTFIQQLASLDFSPPSSAEAFELDDAKDEFDDSQRSNAHYDTLEEVLAHNTLASLWTHMIAEFASTISVNANNANIAVSSSSSLSSSSSVSPLLTAEFRTSDTGALIGRRSFASDDEVLNRYVRSVMRFWRGEREACGVDVEEAYKCNPRICEFADSCEWRAKKVEDSTAQARAKHAAARQATEMKNQV